MSDSMRRPTVPKTRISFALPNVLHRKIKALARREGITLQALVERGLRMMIAERGATISKDEMREQWRKDNREAIAAYNEHLRSHGSFSSREKSPFRLRDASVGGEGIHSNVAGRSWDEIRSSSYEGRARRGRRRRHEPRR
jgi:post-segregation antitoxin (ccd killing protein)